MTTHTQCALSVWESPYESNRFNLTANGNWLFSVLHNGEQLVDTQRENLRRLAACWNACQNIETETLEQHALGVITAEHSQRLHDMEAALKQAAKINPFGSVENAKARDAAISIVIKREGEAP